MRISDWSSDVCSSDLKANVMESGVLLREEVTKLHQEKYKDVQIEHMYADNGAMQLVRNPTKCDVMVTDNLFGVLLSDAATMMPDSRAMRSDKRREGDGCGSSGRYR